MYLALAKRHGGERHGGEKQHSNKCKVDSNNENHDSKKSPSNEIPGGISNTPCHLQDAVIGNLLTMSTSEKGYQPHFHQVRNKPTTSPWK